MLKRLLRVLFLVTVQGVAGMIRGIHLDKLHIGLVKNTMRCLRFDGFVCLESIYEVTPALKKA